MKRHDDWQGRLTDYVVPLMGAEFSFGQLDCALFAAGAVKAMTGKDLAWGFRSYRTLKGGLKKLKAAGYDDHIALAADKLPEIPPSFAQVGDVAVVETDEGPALGVVQGETIYVMRLDGLGLVPLTTATRAFRVGE